MPDAPNTPPTDLETELRAWLIGRLPDGWFTGAPEVSADRDEVLVTGVLAEPDLADAGHPAPEGGDVGDQARAAGRAARIQRFREETRAARMQVADEVEQRFGRKVAWGARCGDLGATFTSLSLP